MKNIPCCLLALFVASSALADSRFYAEAGVSYVALTGARYTNSAGSPALPNGSVVAGSPTPASTFSLQSEDKSSWAPYLSAGYNFTDQVALQFSYSHLGNLSASGKALLLVGGDAVVGEETLRFNDDVHVVSFSPQFKWPVTSRLSLRIAPELNWVASRGEILITNSNPAANTIPRFARHEEQFTFGASVGGLWTLTEKCDLAVSYKYADLKPSWNRAAHFVSFGLHWHF